jgi:hypothetical protein
LPSRHTGGGLRFLSMEGTLGRGCRGPVTGIPDESVSVPWGRDGSAEEVRRDHAVTSGGDRGVTRGTAERLGAGKKTPHVERRREARRSEQGAVKHPVSPERRLREPTRRGCSSTE